MKTSTTKDEKKVVHKTDEPNKDLLISFWHYVNENTTAKAVNYSEEQQEAFINGFLESTKQ